MKVFSLLIIFLLSLGCSSKGAKLQKQTVIFKDSIFIQYKFNNAPWVFKFSSNGDIYISDGYEIVKFNQDGKLGNSIRLSSANEKITPVIDFVFLDSSQFFASARGNIFSITKVGTKILNSGKNFSLRIDPEGNLYSTFQDYQKSKGTMYNGFHYMKGNISNDYPDKFDYANLNFEIINDYLMFYSADGFFYKLPTDTSKSYIKEQIPSLMELNDRIWFLGKDKGYYVFKYNNFNNGKRDIIFFFDSNLKLVKKADVNHNTSDNAKPTEEYEFSFQNPSGILYSYNNYDESIYILKNIKSGIYIYKLNKQLKEIKSL